MHGNEDHRDDHHVQLVSCKLDIGLLANMTHNAQDVDEAHHSSLSQVKVVELQNYVDSKQ